MADEKTPTPTDKEMSSAKRDLGNHMYLDQREGPGKGAGQDVAEDDMNQITDAVKGKEGQNPHGFMDFLLQFMKANPDLAREMSTRMNAVINGKKLDGMKGGGMNGPMPQNPLQGGQMPQSMGSPQPPTPGQPPQQMAGDVIPMPGDRSMGGGPTSTAAPYATGQQQAPGVVPIGNDTLKGWYERAMQQRQG